MLKQVLDFYKTNIFFQLFIHGLLSSLAFAPLYLIIILFFTFPFFLEQIVNEKAIKTLIKKAFAFGLGYFIGGLYWICSSLLIEPLFYGWLVPFCITLIPAILSIYIIITSIITNYYAKFIKNKFVLAVIFSIVFVFFEWLRGILFTGLPWNILSSSIAFSSLLLQPISVLNSYGYSIILMLLFCSQFYFKTNKKLTHRFYSLVFIILILSGIRIEFAKQGQGDINIRLVQPNIPQSLKWEPELIKQHFNDLINLSKSVDTTAVDYFIWPESGIQYSINLKQQNNEIMKYLNDNLLNNEKRLITGFVRENSNYYYNSLMVLEGKRVLNYYDKYFLVPFGEFIPFKKFIPFINKITNGAIDFTRGKKQETINDGKLPIFSPNICYESIFYDSINRNSKLIINITNDSWFGTTSGPYQHFDNLKLRAVENNQPAIRVGNSGISGVINSLGQVENIIKLNEKAILDVKIPITKSFDLPKIKEKYLMYFILIVLFLIRLRFCFIK